MRRSLEEIGCYVTTQFGNIAPADKVNSRQKSHCQTFSRPPEATVSL